MRASRNQDGGGLPPRAGAHANDPDAAQPAGEGTFVVTKAGDPRNAPEVRAEDIGARDGMVAGTAVDEDVRDPQAEVLRYVITREAPYVDRNGHRVKLPVGKIVDSLNYNVKDMLRRGVRMTELKDGADPADILQEHYGRA